MITCAFEKGYSAKLRHVVVHAIVEKNNGILLVKRTGDLLESGKWGLPGGYLDRDETAPEGALRELFEETGWKGEVISLFRLNTNPNRPHEDRQNISFDYVIRPTERTGSPDHESSAVSFVPLDSLLPFDEYAFDHGDTIRMYLEYRKNHTQLPILE
jgi:ADP-ribose pyrophosphatase YjhB (NUDIX family)